uniref:TAP-C domain-containing protein n=1 Tax=Acrobeloides nanus TaxID=290746 RepID=A0A914C6D8_9BILA
MSTYGTREYRPRQDVKARTMRISAIDPDVTFRYEYEDDEEAQQKPDPSGIQAALQSTDAISQMTIESANASAPPSSPSQAPSAYEKSNPAIQQVMIEQFSQQSGMKSEWSRQCLEDQNWDFEMAGRSFLELRDSIPPEAFI